MGWEEAEELPLSAEVSSSSQCSQTSEPSNEFSFLPGYCLFEEQITLVCRTKTIWYLFSKVPQRILPIKSFAVLCACSWVLLKQAFILIVVIFFDNPWQGGQSLWSVLVVLNCKVKYSWTKAVDSCRKLTWLIIHIKRGKFSLFFPSFFLRFCFLLFKVFFFSLVVI